MAVISVEKNVILNLLLFTKMKDKHIHFYFIVMNWHFYAPEMELGGILFFLVSARLFVSENLKWYLSESQSKGSKSVSVNLALNWAGIMFKLDNANFPTCINIVYMQYPNK